MVAYTDAARIANSLGVVLTAGQITQAGVLAQAATDWIDDYKGRSWQAVSPISGEVHTVSGDRVYLDHRPVATLTTVETRGAYIGGAYTALAAGQYDLIDAANGVLQVTGYGNYLVRVAYTHTGTAPPSHIALAATVIAASWLGPTMVGLPSGVDQISLGQNDINVKFSKDARDVPPEALTLLGARAIAIA